MTDKQDTRKKLAAKILHLAKTNPKFGRRVASILRKRKEASEQDSEPSSPSLRGELIRLAHASDDKDLRRFVAGLFVTSKNPGAIKIAHMPYLSQRGNLSKERLDGKGLTKNLIRSGDGFALYNIDRDRNHSKFYEGMIYPEKYGDDYRVVFRWGAMTDSGFTGRVDGRKYDEKFSGLDYDQAIRTLNTKKRAKLGRGYVDTFGPKHKDPATGKRLKQGEYPVGLAREVGFGWGTQEMAYCVPALRHIAEAIAKALDPTDGTDAVIDLKNALRLVRDVPDSSMAGKITKFIGNALRGISRGDDPRDVNKKLFTIKNYIDKQIALCPA